MIGLIYPPAFSFEYLKSSSERRLARSVANPPIYSTRNKGVNQRSGAVSSDKNIPIR